MNKRHLIAWLIGGLLFIALTHTLLKLSQTVSAQARPTQGEWIDTATISYDGSLYVDRRIGDEKPGLGGNRNYKKNNQQTGCIAGEIDYISDTQGRLRLREQHPETGQCSQVHDSNITLTNPQNARLWFYRVDTTTLRAAFSEYAAGSLPGTGRTAIINGSDYVLDESVDRYIAQTGGSCLSSVQVTGPDTGTYYPRHPFGNGCQSFNSFAVRLGTIDSAPDDSFANNPGGGASSTDRNSCESRGTALAWILCPVIKLLDATMNFVDTQIQAMLDVDRTTYNNEDIKESWATIRNIAYIILIPITLVMVIGTAIGSSLVDAYTVKKAMPRLAIAVIFIALSYNICVFLIELFNTVGYGMIGLLTSPFGSQVGTLTLADLFGTTNVLMSFLQILIFGPAVLLLLWFFGTTFLLLVGTAFLILTLRQLFIIGLLLVAPLAILAWIFPGNDKLWKLWWGSFSKLLIMFPLIMGIIAMGRIFAFIADADRGGGLEGSILTPFVKLAAYMLPYAFIPFTFKFAGGIFANIAGVVNDKEKGLFDRQKKKRAENWQGFKSGVKTPPGFRGNNIASRGLRRIGGGIGAGWRGRAGFGTRGAGHRDLTHRAEAAERIKDPKMQQLGFDDDGIAAMALSGGTRRGAERRLRQMGWDEARVQRAVNKAEQVGFDKSNAIAGAEVMARNKSRALTGQWAGDAGMQLVRDSMAEVSDSQPDLTENLMGSFAYHSRGAGRADLGGEGVNQSAEQGWRRTSVAQHMQGTGISTGHYAQHFAHSIRNGTADDRRTAAIALAEMQGSMPYATAENQEHINNALESIGVQHGLTRTERRMATRNMTDARGNLLRDAAGDVRTEQYEVEEQIPLSVEQQLSNIASGLDATGSVMIDPATGAAIPGPPPPARVITASEINGLARKYGGVEGARQNIDPATGQPMGP